jgi:hypothetical protein
MELLIDWATYVTIALCLGAVIGYRWAISDFDRWTNQ